MVSRFLRDPQALRRSNLAALSLARQTLLRKSEKGSGVWSDFRLFPYGLPMKLQKSGHMTLWWSLIGIVSHVIGYC